MKRTWLGIGILAFFLLTGLLSTNWVERLCDPICDNLEKARFYMENQDISQAIQWMEKAYEAWDHNRNQVAAFVNHEPMDEIDGLFSQTRIYGKQQAAVAFAAGCGRLSELICALSQSHKLTWWNLLSVFIKKSVKFVNLFSFA